MLRVQPVSQDEPTKTTQESQVFNDTAATGYHLLTSFIPDSRLDHWLGLDERRYEKV